MTVAGTELGGGASLLLPDGDGDDGVDGDDGDAFTQNEDPSESVPSCLGQVPVGPNCHHLVIYYDYNCYDNCY